MKEKPSAHRAETLREQPCCRQFSSTEPSESIHRLWCRRGALPVTRRQRSRPTAPTVTGIHSGIPDSIGESQGELQEPTGHSFPHEPTKWSERGSLSLRRALRWDRLKTRNCHHFRLRAPTVVFDGKFLTLSREPRQGFRKPGLFMVSLTPTQRV